MQSIGVSLRAQTRLCASPHMQQAVHLLQLSVLDFTQELQQALSTNPFLEETEEDEDPSDQESLDESSLDAQQAASTLEGGDVEDPIEGNDTLEAPLGEDAAYEAFDQLTERQEQRDPFDEATSSSASSGGADPSSVDALDWVSSETSLREHLLGQVCGWNLSPRMQRAAAVVVDSIDDDGYLRSDIAAAAEVAGLQPALSSSEIEQAIRFVQACDPPGVGARDLSECLVLQIEALESGEPASRLAVRIATAHLDDLAHHRYATLRQALSCNDEALNLACSLIRRLDPRPGHRYSRQRTEYVVPDVIVRVRGGEPVVLVNPSARPRARLNQCYAQWFRAARQQDNPLLSQQLQEARWLMHNVEQRFVTIQRVAEAIVRRQRSFFDGGEIALKPLVLREVADDLGIHESTVSRATGNKYMDTPRGLFEFRHFFSRKLATETGGECSAAAVRALMSDMLATEKASSPLSDVALTHLLWRNGVRVSRRTVTKYRNLMKVAPVELRKRA